MFSWNFFKFRESLPCSCCETFQAGNNVCSFQIHHLISHIFKTGKVICAHSHTPPSNSQTWHYGVQAHDLSHRYTSKVRCTCKMPKVSHRLIYDLYWRCGVKGRRVTDVNRYACIPMLGISCKTFPCIRGHICETFMLSINRIMFSFIVNVCSNLAYLFLFFVANFCLSLYLD